MTDTSAGMKETIQILKLRQAPRVLMDLFSGSKSLLSLYVVIAPMRPFRMTWCLLHLWWHGLINFGCSQSQGLYCHLTTAGRSLELVFNALSAWGDKYADTKK